MFLKSHIETVEGGKKRWKWKAGWPHVAVEQQEG